jgi:hypothetical protein
MLLAKYRVATLPSLSFGRHYGFDCAACTPLTLAVEPAVQLLLVAPVAPPAVLPFKFTK